MWRAPYVVVFLLIGLGCAFLFWKFDFRSIVPTPSAGMSSPGDRGLSNADKDFALETAIRKNQLSQEQQLLDAGANPNGRGGDILAAATAPGNQAALDLLLKAGGKPDCFSVYMAVAHHQTDMVTRLLRMRVTLQDGSCSPLRKAVEDNQLNMARLLLAAGADVHNRIKVNDPTDEPIEIARRKGDPAMLRLLQQGR